MSIIQITHTREQGTLLAGSARGDGVADIIKPLGWTWFRSLGCWGLRSSRDREARRYRIDQTANALIAASHTVAITIDDTARPTAEVEADRADRQEARADALDAKADRHAADAEAADARATAAVGALPPGGEPIHVGHYSERRHRNAIARAGRTMTAAIAATEKAAETSRRAAVARDAADRHNDPVRVGNRIQKIEAEIRATQRALDGRLDWVDGKFTTRQPSPEYAERLTARLAEQHDQLAYWQEVRAAQITAGQVTDYGPHNVKRGDKINYRGIWYPVRRVNKKSVSIPAMIGMGRDDMGWSDTIPWHEIRGHKPAEQS